VFVEVKVWAVWAVVPLRYGVITYAVMADPPFEGAVQVTVAWVFPGVAVTPVGVPGTLGMVTEFDDADEVLVPTSLVAVTVNV
jgi:hypothetical protein